MAQPIAAGNTVKRTAQVIAETAEEAESELYSILQSGSVDPVEYLMAIGKLLPLLSMMKGEANEIVNICEKYAIRRRSGDGIE